MTAGARTPGSHRRIEKREWRPTLAYLTSQDGRRRAGEGVKRGKFGGNKATMLFRMSNLIQKWSENKPMYLRTSFNTMVVNRGRRKTKPFGDAARAAFRATEQLGVVAQFDVEAALGRHLAR